MATTTPPVNKSATQDSKTRMARLKQLREEAKKLNATLRKLVQG